MKIGVVIPALDEEAVIARTLDQLRGVAAVVADGGSSDSTRQIAEAAGARVVEERGSRGVRQNAGVKALYDVEVLLFLHADTVLPRDWMAHVSEVLTAGAALGAFRLLIEGATPAQRFIAYCANLRSRWLGLPYGDQALFLSKNMFERLGGFGDLPIMEDYDLVRRARRHGRIVIASAAVTTSARRWQKRGALRTTVVNQLMLVGWLIGIAPERLAAFYRRSR